MHAICSNKNRRNDSECESAFNLQSKWVVPNSKTDGFLTNQSDEYCTEYSLSNMNESTSSTTKIIVRSDTERNSTGTEQCYNAGSRFRGTRNMPYAYWSSECQSERAPALRENAFWSGVLDKTDRDVAGVVRRSERIKEFFWGRSKADQSAQWNQGREDQSKYSRVWLNNVNWALNSYSWQGKDDFVV